jgi:hypothetical protein
MSGAANTRAQRDADAQAELVARRTAARKATIEKTKQERLARRQRYRALCFFNPVQATMEEEPSWS